MARVLQIPIRRGVAAQTLTVILDGRRYGLTLGWNGRLGRWTVGLDGVFAGRILATRADLLRQHRYRDDVPPGVLALVDVSGRDREASFESLGAEDGHALVYVEADEVEIESGVASGSGGTPPTPTD